MIYLVLYDISNDSLRTKIAGRLVAAGYERIQLSVFLGIWNPKDNTTLWSELQSWLAQDKTSKLFVIPMTKNGLRKMQILGDFKPDIDYWVGEQHTLFI